MSKLPHVQVLRALAALSIAMLHAQFDAGAIAERVGRGFRAIEALPWLAGVDVFFVISGFIMVHASRPSSPHLAPGAFSSHVGSPGSCLCIGP